MRSHLALILALVGLTVVSAAEAERARTIDQTCPRVIDVGRPSSTIYKQSAPLRAGGPGTPIIGFRREPTLIYNARNFSGGAATIYDSRGNRLASCPHTSAIGHAGRARCTVQTASVRRAAVAKTRSPAIFFKINRNTCVRVPDAGRCVGSVKGLCNQLIK